MDRDAVFVELSVTSKKEIVTRRTHIFYYKHVTLQAPLYILASRRNFNSEIIFTNRL